MWRQLRPPLSSPPPPPHVTVWRPGPRRRLTAGGAGEAWRDAVSRLAPRHSARTPATVPREHPPLAWLHLELPPPAGPRLLLCSVKPYLPVLPSGPRSTICSLLI